MRSPNLNAEMRALLFGQGVLFRALRHVELGVKVDSTGAVSIPGGLNIGGSGDSGLVLGPSPEGEGGTVPTLVHISNVKPSIVSGVEHTQSADEKGSTITFTWASPDTSLNVDLQGTEFRWKRQDKAEWAKVLVPDYDHTVDVIGGLTYDFELRYVTIMGVRSDVYSTSVKIDGDKTKPAKVQNVQAAVGYRTVMVAWDANTEADLDYYRVQITKAASFNSDEKLGDMSTTLGNEATNILREEKVRTTLITISDLEVQQTYSVRVKAVDFSGNESEEWAEDLDGITEMVESAHIRELFASKIKSGTITSSQITLDTGAGNSYLRSALFNGDPLDPFDTPGSEGWAINGAGDAAFNNVKVRGEVEASSFTADIAGADSGKVDIGVVSLFGQDIPAIQFPTENSDEVDPAFLTAASFDPGGGDHTNFVDLSSAEMNVNNLPSHIQLQTGGPSLAGAINFLSDDFYFVPNSGNAKLYVRGVPLIYTTSASETADATSSTTASVAVSVTLGSEYNGIPIDMFISAQLVWTRGGTSAASDQIRMWCQYGGVDQHTGGNSRSGTQDTAARVQTLSMTDRRRATLTSNRDLNVMWQCSANSGQHTMFHCHMQVMVFPVLDGT